MGQLTNTSRSDDTPAGTGWSPKEVTTIKIRHYRNVYLNHPDPIVFIPLTVDFTGRLYDEFIRILFLHSHRESSVLTDELVDRGIGPVLFP
jgi:hypothetical protein